ncbi:leucine--tRNA ligase [Candidatus Woesearchaeota archaeon]|nr:leucine--tRNA ligase [Candidatus Woesearchaeota archaeon]
MVEFNDIAKKWQERWAKKDIFKVKEGGKKFYVLEMYPYPSGSGLHMGHARNYCIGDVFARFKRMHGLNVLYPMGYDSFGLPAENAAIKAKSHPKVFTEKAIATFIQQQKGLGLSYDWSRMVETHKPDYYRWDQWIFLKMYEKGLAYKKNNPVNWCPECNTVLANEQVHDGKCWRHTETDVEPKELEQWYFKTTAYAEELYDDIEKLKNWSEDVKLMQKNWINKKEWIDIEYAVDGTDKKLTVSTTRPDTNFGATFIVIAPEHELLTSDLIPEDKREAVKAYIEEAKKKTDEERIEESGKKTGVFTGLYCINQLTNKKMPIWVSDFVLMNVGTGVVVGVPGHDMRDFKFAKEYGLEIVRVVVGKDGDTSEITRKEQVQEEEGVMINSGFLDGMDIRAATKKIMDHMEEKGYGKRTIRYRLRDWLISRQRFWGTPIPIIYCDDCGIVPVPEKDLPVTLPDDIKFSSASNPLVDHEPFVKAACPKCGKEGRRETDTMDTFVNSSWYFLRYCDSKNDKEIFDPKKANYWVPIDQYIGGKEHACMHLIYFRFYTKFLRDIGLLKIDEPTLNLFNQGMLHGSDGYVMSKSRGNVVLPEEVSKKYGIDTARWFLMFVAGPDKDMEWSDKGAEGSFRFLKKFYTLLEKSFIDKDAKQESKINKTIKNVSEYIENFKFNMATIGLMEMANYLHSKEEIQKSVLERLVVMMSAFAPHISEEMWETLGHKEFVSLAKWPSFDEKKIDHAAEALEDAVGQLTLDIKRVLDLIKKEAKEIKLITSPEWKYAFFSTLKKEMEKTRDMKDIMGTCMQGELKKHGQDISRLVPAILKDPKKMPAVILSSDEEFKNLQEAAPLLKGHFKAEIIVEKGDDSKEEKAKNASPGKPSIVIK